MVRGEALGESEGGMTRVTCTVQQGRREGPRLQVFGSGRDAWFADDEIRVDRVFVGRAVRAADQSTPVSLAFKDEMII